MEGDRIDFGWSIFLQRKKDQIEAICGLTFTCFIRNHANGTLECSQKKFWDQINFVIHSIIPVGKSFACIEQTLHQMYWYNRGRKFSDVVIVQSFSFEVGLCGKANFQCFISKLACNFILMSLAKKLKLAIQLAIQSWEKEGISWLFLQSRAMVLTDPMRQPCNYHFVAQYRF